MGEVVPERPVYRRPGECICLHVPRHGATATESWRGSAHRISDPECEAEHG